MDPFDQPILANDFPAHHVMLTKFLENYLIQSSEKKSLGVDKTGRKLAKFSHDQFLEFSVDIYDEETRRLANGNEPLESNLDFPIQRNQARAKLATLPLYRFQKLAAQVLLEIERRFPFIKLEHEAKAGREANWRQAHSMYMEYAQEVQVDAAPISVLDMQEPLVDNTLDCVQEDPKPVKKGFFFGRRVTKSKPEKVHSMQTHASVSSSSLQPSIEEKKKTVKFGWFLKRPSSNVSESLREVPEEILSAPVRSDSTPFETILNSLSEGALPVANSDHYSVHENERWPSDVLEPLETDEVLERYQEDFDSSFFQDATRYEIQENIESPASQNIIQVQDIVIDEMKELRMKLREQRDANLDLEIKLADLDCAYSALEDEFEEKLAQGIKNAVHELTLEMTSLKEKNELLSQDKIRLKELLSKSGPHLLETPRFAEGRIRSPALVEGRIRSPALQAGLLNRRVNVRSGLNEHVSFSDPLGYLEALREPLFKLRLASHDQKSSNVLPSMRQILMICQALTKDAESLDISHDTDRDQLLFVVSRLSEDSIQLMAAARAHVATPTQETVGSIERLGQKLTESVENVVESMKLAMDREDEDDYVPVPTLSRPFSPEVAPSRPAFDSIPINQLLNTPPVQNSVQLTALKSFIEGQADVIAEEIQEILLTMRQATDGAVMQSLMIKLISSTFGLTSELFKFPESFWCQFSADGNDHVSIVLKALDAAKVDLESWSTRIVVEISNRELKQLVVNRSFEIAKQCKELLIIMDPEA